MQDFTGFIVFLALFQVFWWTWIVWKKPYEDDDEGAVKGLIAISIILLVLDAIFALRFILSFIAPEMV